MVSIHTFRRDVREDFRWREASYTWEGKRPEDKRREGRVPAAVWCMCIVWPDWRLLARVLLTGWDEKGIFIFGGGCYAKIINLTEETEPEIYLVIK